jgi:hypothetical protein
MTGVTVCNCIEPGKPERLKINTVNLKGSVQNLKDGISKKINKSVSEFGKLILPRRGDADSNSSDSCRTVALWFYNLVSDHNATDPVMQKKLQFS